VPIARDFFARPAVEVAPELLGCVLEHQTAAGLVAVELTEVEAYAGQTDPASHAYRGKTRRNAVMFGPPGHAYVYFTYGMHFCVNLVCLGEDSVSAVLLRAGAVIEGEDLARARRSSRRGGRETVTPPPIAQPPIAQPPIAQPPIAQPAIAQPAIAQPAIAQPAIAQPAIAQPAIARAPIARAPIAWRDLARGPARLCQALDIDKSLDGADVCVADSPLRVRVPAAGTTDRSAIGLVRNPAGTRREIAAGPRVGVALAAEVPWRFWFAGEPTVSVYRAHVPRHRKLVTP
jgi:DNA-3-methyladenine glycosylase